MNLVYIVASNTLTRLSIGAFSQFPAALAPYIEIFVHTSQQCHFASQAIAKMKIFI